MGKDEDAAILFSLLTERYSIHECFEVETW